MTNCPHARIKKVKPFQELMIHIKAHHGSVPKACKSVGISENSYTKLMRDDDVGALVGGKILKHYNQIKGIESAAQEMQDVSSTV